jgi:hypothetical protein
MGTVVGKSGASPQEFRGHRIEALDDYVPVPDVGVEVCPDQPGIGLHVIVVEDEQFVGGLVCASVAGSGQAPLGLVHPAKAVRRVKRVELGL